MAFEQKAHGDRDNTAGVTAVRYLPPVEKLTSLGYGRHHVVRQSVDRDVSDPSI